MRPLVSQFKIHEESTKHLNWANYASENVLLRTYNKVQPWTDLTEPVLRYLAESSPSLVEKRTPLQDWLQGNGRVRMIDTDEFKWRLKGTGEIKAQALENLMPGVATPGIQTTEFPIKLNTDWFVEGDRLAPDIRKDVQVVIKGLPVSDGTGYIYNVQLVDKDKTSYFPPDLLEPRINWIKLDAVYGEASSGYGSTQFYGGSWIEFMASITDYGKTVEVTNKAHELNLKMTFCDDKGKEIKDYPSQIISYIEAEFLAQAKWEKELGLFYGRSAGKNIIDPTSGKHRRVGPGLMEFLQDGNIIPYPMNGGSISMFVEYLQSVWFDRVSPGDRQIVVYTGQGGLTLWNKWVREEFSESAIVPKYDDFVGKGASHGANSGPSLSMKNPYFNDYQIFPWGNIRVEHWPILDSTYLNGGVLHPETGLPVSSYDFIILDYGMGSGDGANIELIKRKNHEVFTYICGTWSPAGPINGRTGMSGFTATHPARSYNLYHTDSYGLRIKDVSLTCIFSMNIV